MRQKKIFETYENIINKDRITGVYVGEHDIEGQTFIVLDKNGLPLQLLKDAWKKIGENKWQSSK
jgi:hypothetical protein